ncbi:uncharacterized protein RHO25_010711 [Cercospora beticola]|uniref:Uncharacterized protein n=1 Tax=Cercospora beticola TaxID=122368 RepID=A0ABZ0P2P7_CERBT|nr:hypothetical protein RHO25_010711 [Cercospora beticola]CAK1365939.1 unnamed protein product [Cercospora beticola]
MSAVAGRTDVPDTELFEKALQLIDDRRDNKFPVISMPKDAKRTSYLDHELKTLLIGIMSAGLWGDLRDLTATPRRHLLPDPADVPTAYRISKHWIGWPNDETKDGIMGHALSQQTNVLADLAFTRLIYQANKTAAKAHFELLKKAQAKKIEKAEKAEQQARSLRTYPTFPGLLNPLTAA